MPPISVLMKPSSGMCNMHCDYCFYCDETSKRQQESYGFMAEQTLKNIIRKTMLRAEGCISYAYQGGEPTLRGIDFYKTALAYQKQYNKHGIQVMNALQTNGLLLDEEWCRFLKEEHFLVGISLDGIREVHDAYRHQQNGGPTYDKVRHAIALLEQYGVDYNILTVVNRKVAGAIEEIYGNYRANGWYYQQYIACLDPLGEEHGTTEYGLRPKEYGEFLIRLFQLWYEDWQQGKAPYIRQIENYIGILAGYQPEACDQRGTCSLQNVVEADGSVYPCDFYMLDEYRLGNLNENRMDDIEARRGKIGFIQESFKIDEACRQCTYYSLCRGGCRRNRDYIRETDTYRSYFCESYRMFFDACIEKMKNVVKESTAR